MNCQVSVERPFDVIFQTSFVYNKFTLQEETKTALKVSRLTCSAFDLSSDGPGVRLNIGKVLQNISEK